MGYFSRDIRLAVLMIGWVSLGTTASAFLDCGTLLASPKHVDASTQYKQYNRVHTGTAALCTAVKQVLEAATSQL